MQDKGEKILKLCCEIECLCEKRKISDANNKIIELLGVVVGNSKYSKDIDFALTKYAKASEGYKLQIIK